MMLNVMPSLMKQEGAGRASSARAAGRVRRWAAVGVLASAGLVSTLARAQAPASPAANQDVDLQVAKTEFENAQTLFIKEQFDAAAEHFLAAFARKPYPAFLFNAAVSFEKSKKLEKAAEFFEKYLDRDPNAPDAAVVRTRIDAIKTILSPPPSPATPGGVVPPPVVPALPAFETKGLVVIESKPQGATIYLDSKTNGVFARTPWQGSLESKPVKLILEAKGFKPEERSISPRSDKLVDVYIALSEEHFLGWIEVVSNVPGAEVYIDRKDIGAIGKTPFTGHVKPGKHTIFVERIGYKSIQQEIDVQPGTATQHMIRLDKGDNGWVNVSGRGAYGAKVTIDKKAACVAPCRSEVTPGVHRVVVQKAGFEDYEGDLRVDRGAETVVEVGWSPKPSKRAAWTTAALAAGFLGGGLYVGSLSNKNLDGVRSDASAGRGVDSNDPRFSRGKWQAVGADVLYGIAALLAVSSAVSFFSHGPDSIGAVDQRQIGFAPDVSTAGAGVSAWGRF